MNGLSNSPPPARLPGGELRELLAIFLADPPVLPARFWAAAGVSESLADAHRLLERDRPEWAPKKALLLAADAEIARAVATGTRIAPFGAPGYPVALETLPDPPPLLFFRGSLPPAEERAIAIVGARKASRYGLAVARRLGRELASGGTVVVSGLARGIDAEAHRGAIEAGGATWAVLGSGLDRLYPPEHVALGRAIVEAGGALVTEFPLETRPFASHFPRRNRIIAGLSAAVVVVEARRKSGSLITAEFAMEQGKDVGAVPGHAGAEESEGTHALLRDGVVLVESAEDVFCALEFDWAKEAMKRLRPERDEPRRSPATLDPETAAVWRALGPAPIGVDDVALAAALPANVVRGALVRLEVDGWAESCPGSLYRRIGPNEAAAARRDARADARGSP